MKRLITATALCALVAGLVVAPGASAVKSPKLVGGTVALAATPVGSPTTSVTVSGNVKTNSSCRKFRIVRFSYTTSGGTTNLVESSVTGPNGDFTATLPAPVPAGQTTLTATVDQVFRKVGSRKKGQRTKRGRRFNCLSISSFVSFPTT